MSELKSIIITTKHRGVWYAEVPKDKDLTPTILTGLKNCRMAIKWGTTKGLQQLADTGPTENTKISPPTDIEVLHDVTAVFLVKEKAKSVWTKAE